MQETSINREDPFHLQELSFGMLTDTPNIHFVPVIDLNGQTLKIPYTQPDITIGDLLK